jgi:ribosome biogenesis GTPase / thiamine phosphate phosphatase
VTTPEDFGWDDGWAQVLAAVPYESASRVVAVHRGRVELHDDQSLPVAGALRDDPPVVGDWVAVEEGAIRAVLPRRSTLRRTDETLVANADLGIVVTSANRDLNDRRTERLAALARDGLDDVLVVLTKGDLSSDPVADAERTQAAASAPVVVVSAQQGWGLEALRAHLTPRRTAVMLGSSGVGKSTLVNTLLGEEVQRTAAIREYDDRGRHATTHRELFRLPNGGLLIDTPGVRRPGLDGDAGIKDTFADIEELALGCRFPDCGHDTEPGCAVRDAVDPARLESWRKLQSEAATAAERKARGREGSKALRSFYEEHGGGKRR